MINKNELPKDWEIKKLGEIADKITDGTHHTPTYISDGIPFISVKDINDQKVSFEKCKYISLQEHNELIKRCNPEEGDVLITKSGTIGRLAIVPNVEFSLFVSVALIKIQKNKQQINQKWLLYFLEFHIAFLDIKSKVKGGVVKNYHLEDLRLIEIFLPPLVEQERIVAKIEELFSELDAGTESLKRAQRQLKIYRQAVLKWAFEGKLTNDKLSNGELPAGWKPAKLGDLAEMCLGKMLDGDKNKGEYQPYLRNINVRWGSFRLDDLEQMRFESDESERYGIKKDDLIVCEGGEPGRCAIWNDTNPNMKIQKALHRVRVNKQLTVRYLFHYLYFSATSGLLERYFTGTTIKHLTGRELKKIEFPICSLEEQQRVVEEIESRLSVCDKLEETIAVNLKQAEALRQSILKKAFEGKLVKVKEIEKSKIPFYQMQTLGLILRRYKQRRISHGEMTAAKQFYLVDRLYDVPTHFQFERGHLGPFPSEFKRIVNVKKYFVHKHGRLEVINENLLFNSQNPYQQQIENAVDELADIFEKITDPTLRSHKTELLATVCKVIEDVQTTEIETVRQSMAEWKIDLKNGKFKNKAEKFDEDETSKCVAFIIKNGWDKKLIN